MSDGCQRPFVVLTRPLGKNEALARRFAQHGIDALALPALKIRPLPVPASGLALPRDFDLIVFVSGNAIRCYLDAWSRETMCSRWPAQTIAATVGISSAMALLQSPAMAGATIIHPPADASQDSESLWALLQPKLPLVKRVLIVRGQEGREWLGSQFEARGVQVTRLAVYQRAAANWPEEESMVLRRYVESGRQGVYVLTSAESVSAFHAKMLEQGFADYWRTARFVVIHPRVAKRLQSLLPDMPVQLSAGGISLCQPDEDAIFTMAYSLASPIKRC